MKWFYEFRAFPGSEFCAAGAGFLAGVLSACIPRKRLYTSTAILTLLGFGMFIPYLKPVMGPISESAFKQKWSQDVCMQSTSSTCGPASVATLFKFYGIDLTEEQIARECFSYIGGTENWYLARAFRKRGFEVHYRIATGLPKDLRLPAIAGVNVGCGHFIPILSETATTYITGDPLAGRQEYKKTDISKHYQFTGFFMEISKRN